MLFTSGLEFWELMIILERLRLCQNCSFAARWLAIVWQMLLSFILDRCAWLWILTKKTQTTCYDSDPCLLGSLKCSFRKYRALCSVLFLGRFYVDYKVSTITSLCAAKIIGAYLQGRIFNLP